MKPTFFCRHGQVGSRDALSTEGYEACILLRELLYGTCAFETALVSPANRCIETAQVLMGSVIEKEFVVDSELRVFVDYQTFIAPLAQHIDVPPRTNFSNWGTVVELYEEHQPDLVVGHDCMPVILAFKLLERRGVKIDWRAQPRELTSLGMGCGVLVSGDTYTYIRSPKTRH
jgi:phosphohistidine phosphatase SixA